MCAEQISSRTSQIADGGRSDSVTLLTDKPELMTGRSRHELCVLRDCSFDLEIDQMDPCKKTAHNSHQEMKEVLGRVQPSSKGPDSLNDRTEDEDVGARYRSFVEQRLAQLLQAELRRVNLNVSVNSGLEQLLQSLSPKEFEVLMLMVHGKTCKEIAAQMKVKSAVASKCGRSALKKLGVRNRVEFIHLLGALSFRNAGR